MKKKNNGDYMHGNEIRQSFLRFFQGNNHTVVGSSSLIPGNDPTLLFTNAGMVQFKDTFLGVDKRDYKRAVSSQKCVRAGGKHNDLEMVGRTARHHTFFEMLGNFSFGNYFKKEAIEMGWEFLTHTMNLPVDKLWVTVYKDDDEAYDFWVKGMKFPAKRLVKLGEKDNFWSMGETGPCGPCSEIIIDQGEACGCGQSTCSIECECDRYLELWNLVFMQFNRDGTGKLSPLPNPSIDTGMGLERLSAVMQGKQNNFDCDLLFPVIKRLENEFSIHYGEDSVKDTSFRIIADHIRSVSFLISDGVIPSNDGRGYVLRRIMRRALRHGKMLGKEGAFFYRIFDTVAELMKDAYPELLTNHDMIAKIIKSEEEGFESTLTHGMAVLHEIIETTKKNNTTLIAGEEVFKLYDTYGFPVDLAEEIASDAGMQLDMAGYENAMQQQKEAARMSWKGSGENPDHKVLMHVAQSLQQVNFTGYSRLQEEVELFSVVQGDREVETAKEGEEVKLVFPVTPFYGESGGQTGDRGKVWNASCQIDIFDTQSPFVGMVVHSGKVIKGEVKKGDSFTVQVDQSRRERIVLNHSATHLLQAALKKVLGEHIKQAGSLVDNDRLRFDFSHFHPLSDKELLSIEALVNEKIRENLPVVTLELEFDEAVSRGATALFGEKYGKKVRMVQMGDFSNELCGGTHAKSTGNIGLMRILGDAGVAAGVRRIEAITGETAFLTVKKEEKSLRQIRGLLKASPEEEADKVRRLIYTVKKFEKENDQLKQKMVNLKGDDLFSQVRTINNVKVLSVNVDGLDGKSLRTFIDTAKEKLQQGIVVAGTKSQGRVLLAAGVTKGLTERFHAGNILKEIAGIVGGSGGGRADMAQAGGKDPDKLNDALEKVFTFIEDQSQSL